MPFTQEYSSQYHVFEILWDSSDKILNKRFIPSGHAALGFAANTIIWLTTDNVVIITLSLVLSILLAESRIESNKHKLSEVVFSSCVGIMLVLIIYGLISLAVH